MHSPRARGSRDPALTWWGASRHDIAGPSGAGRAADPKTRRSGECRQARLIQELNLRRGGQNFAFRGIAEEEPKPLEVLLIERILYVLNQVIAHDLSRQSQPRRPRG